MKLNPCIVFASGIFGTGKTTVLKELAKSVDNAFLLARDDINKGNLYVSVYNPPELPSFQEYVVNDGIFPEHARIVNTPFGEMIELDPINTSGRNSNFYGRHIRDQSYLVQTEIAQTSLELGKVPLIDCIVARQIRDGTLRRFMDQPAFQPYPRYLVHFIADMEDCRQRVLERAKKDPYASTRVEAQKASSKEDFHRFVREIHPMIPDKLADYEHLIVNTSESSLENAVNEVLAYISS